MLLIVVVGSIVGTLMLVATVLDIELFVFSFVLYGA